MKKVSLKKENRARQKKIRKEVASGHSLASLMGKHDPAASGKEEPRIGMVGDVGPGGLFNTVYFVEEGDTLGSIARKFGTTVAKLRELNGLTERQAGQLRIRQKIKLK